MECSYCGFENTDEATECARCGDVLPTMLGFERIANADTARLAESG